MTAEYKWYTYRFGQSGNVATVPDAIQGGGDVSYQEGWGSDYELDPETQANAKFISRTQHNQLWADVTGNVNYWQQNLYPLYTPAADNGGTPVSYQFGTRVRYNAGSGESVYEVINAAGTTSLPTVTANWVLVASAYPRYGSADGQQRNNLENNNFYDDRYKAFAKTGDVTKTFDSGIIARGFLLEDGEPVSRTTYADLYAEIGDRFGDGDGSTTFDLRRSFDTDGWIEHGSFPGNQPNDVAVNILNNDVWLCDVVGGIYKQTGGVGPYVLIASAGTSLSGITVNEVNDDVYVSGFDGSVRRLAAGIAPLLTLSPAPGPTLTDIAVNSSNGDLWATATDVVYRLEGGAGSWISGTLIGVWLSISVDPNTGWIYTANATNDQVYVRQGTAASTNAQAEIPGIGGISEVYVNPVNKEIWVVDFTGQIFMRRNGQNLWAIQGGYAGFRPSGIGFFPGSMSAYVSDSAQGKVYKMSVVSYIKT